MELELTLEHNLKVVAINLSNHPSDKWSQEQRDALYSIATEGYDPHVAFQIVDIHFPMVPPEASKEDITKLAQKVLKKLNKYNYKHIMIQGEHTLTHMLVNELLAQGKVPVAATTARVAVEKDGIKTSEFKFVRFREY